MSEARNYVVVAQDIRRNQSVEYPVRAFGVEDALAQIHARKEPWLDVRAIYPVSIPFATLWAILRPDTPPKHLSKRRKRR